MKTTGIYHVNINCTNLERSFAFYEMLGFKEVMDFPEVTGPQMEAIGLPGAKGRAKMLRLGDDPHSCHIDLIEWTDPPTSGRPYEHLANVGIGRVCLYSKDLRGDCEELKSNGVSLYSEPKVVPYSGGESLIVCFEDPDGSVIELTQLGPQSSERG